MIKMGESMAKFPTEIWIHIVSKGTLDKATLASISLVSRALRDVAQRKLFHDVTFRYQSSLAMYDAQVDLYSYGDKVLGICTCPRLCSFIQKLRIVFCNNAPWELPHTDLTDRPFCDMMDEVAIALPTMVILSRISYHAPMLFGNLHRAILSHSHLKVVVITPSTDCKKPCKKPNVWGGPHQSLQELEISEWSPVQPIHGLGSRYIGARRCFLTSNILVTHSLSLRKLRVPVLLLYDALAALSTVPEFPHLNTLSIMRFCPLPPLEHLYDSMENHVVRFLLQVHQTIQQLDWRGYAPFNPFRKLPPSCFPKLETLEGEGVELLLGHHALRRLRLIAPPGPAKRTKREEEKTSLKALQECQMSSPQLTTLFVHQFIISWELGPVIAAFSALEELSCSLRIGMGPGGPEFDVRIVGSRAAVSHAFSRG
jgi:F-box-like